ncbi:hypothetical protein PN36_12740 [Candidatus Thiomargarita nelsonii]|uniref:Uncharacterized protein n=1 Tax=Candidatus Thiomargarita nelsonii TaxID=1003181 RepID=A0A0A6PEH7_9GAMM|nr:hypothetical protein PN36_12740 [Candidatus Thiomargarita nelsonii]
MDIEMTAEQVADLGKRWGNAYLSSLPVDELLDNYDRRQKILAQLKPQEILSQFKPQERLTGLKPQELDELEDYFEKRKQKREN